MCSVVGWRADRAILLGSVRARSTAVDRPYGAVVGYGGTNPTWSDFLPREWESVRQCVDQDTPAGRVRQYPDDVPPTLAHGREVVRWDATVRFGWGRSTWEVYSRWRGTSSRVDEEDPHTIPAPPAVRAVATRNARAWVDGFETSATRYVFLPTWAALALQGSGVRGGAGLQDVMGRLAALEDETLATVVATLAIDPTGYALCDVLRLLGASEGAGM